MSKKYDYVMLIPTIFCIFIGTMFLFYSSFWFSSIVMFGLAIVTFVLFYQSSKIIKPLVYFCADCDKHYELDMPCEHKNGVR